MKSSELETSRSLASADIARVGCHGCSVRCEMACARSSPLTVHGRGKKHTVWHRMVGKLNPPHTHFLLLTHMCARGQKN